MSNPVGNKGMKKHGEHGPVLGRVDTVPLSAYRTQENLLRELKILSAKIEKLEMQRSSLVDLAREKHISWRRIGEATNIPWQSWYHWKGPKSEND